MKKLSAILSVVFVISVILAACATPTPQAVVEKQVIQTQIVEKQVIQTQLVEKQVPVVQTQIVQQTVVAPKSGKLIGYGAPELSGGQGVIMNGMLTGIQQKGWAVVPTNANFDASKQADQIDYFLSLGADAIVVVPQDSKAICAAAKKAKDAGVYFFTIDRGVTGCKIDMTVQSDNYLAGKQSGEALVEMLKKKYNGEAKGTVLELQGDLGQNVAQLRGGGFNDVLKQYPNVKVIQKPTEWKAEKFSQAVLDVVAAEPVDGIYMHSDCVGTVPVLAALDQLKKKVKADDPKHILLVGVDGCPDALKSIRDGFSDEASSQPLPDFGVVIADFIQTLFDGGQLKEGTITKEGAPWSPATVVKSDTGFIANLATTKVLKDNAQDKGLWGNQ